MRNSQPIAGGTAISIAEIDMDEQRRWIGREEVAEETISVMPGRMLAATLEQEAAPPAEGEELSPLAHWLHFIPLHGRSELAEDGHVRRGGFMPPVPLPRRMFAGARIEFIRPLRVGEKATRTGRVTGLVAKQGRSGPLVFASVRQEIVGEEGLALVEEQDIVYRDHPAEQPAASAMAPKEAPSPISRRYLPDEAMLFRYSALIFNAHRIHYDHPYTTQKEHYPALVVHGQLAATCLADLAQRTFGRRLATFSFKAVRPLFVGRPFTACADEENGGLRLRALDAEGAVSMEARATPRLE